MMAVIAAEAFMIQRAQLERTRRLAAGPCLSLRLQTNGGTFTDGRDVRFTAAMVNEGSCAVVLVEPSDGSEAGWRTPFVGWSVLADDSTPHPDRPSLRPARGENVNPFSIDEIFELAPGETRRLSDWISPPILRRPGRFRIVMYYRNDPEAEMQGRSFDEHDPAALALVRVTTRCALRSNEVTIEILD